MVLRDYFGFVALEGTLIGAGLVLIFFGPTSPRDSAFGAGIIFMCLAAALMWGFMKGQFGRKF